MIKFWWRVYYKAKIHRQYCFIQWKQYRDEDVDKWVEYWKYGDGYKNEYSKDKSHA